MANNSKTNQQAPQMAFPRICIVGAGSLSTRQIYPRIGQAGAQLVGICDFDTKKAEANALRWGGTVYGDMLTMLDAEKPDGVIICIGPGAHAELAPQVMAKGIPVYTEKPPAPSSIEALEVARVSARTGILCTTAFKKRYSAAYEAARNFINEFSPEDRFSLSIDYASAQYENTNERSKFLLDFCVHCIDLSGYLFGDAAEVFAFAKGPDAFAVSVKYTCGAVGSYNFTDGRSFQIPTEEVEITLKGGNFMTVRNSSSWRITRDGAASQWREPPLFTSAGDLGRETGHLTELEDFVNAVREGRTTTRSNIYESYKSMVLYDAIVASVDSGEKVTVEYEEL